MGNNASSDLTYGEKLDNDMKLICKKSCTSLVGREGHCATSLGNKMFVFGGITLSGDDGKESNELLTFQNDTEEWTVLSGTGDVPSARSAASITAVDNNLYLFGGLSREVGWLNDLHKFDIQNKSWTKLNAEGNLPSPRDKLATVAIDDKIYLFGGFGPKNEIDEDLEDDEESEEEEEAEGAQFGWFNDLFIYDTKTNTWSNPLQMNLGVPTARAAHAMCAVKRHLVIFGGRDAQARRNDLHILDTESMKWVEDLEKLVSGRQPEPRSFHSATTVGHRVVVFGGRGVDNQHFNDLHIFDTETRQWIQPEIQGDAVSGRGLHTATLTGHHLLLFGGSSNFDPETMQCQHFHNDMYSISAADITRGKVIKKCLVENEENVPMEGEPTPSKASTLLSKHSTPPTLSETTNAQLNQSH